MFRRVLAVFFTLSVLLFSPCHAATETLTIPDYILTKHDRVLFTKGEILHGQALWEEISFRKKFAKKTMQDWTTDWINRQTALLMENLTHKKLDENFDYDGLSQKERKKLTQKIEKEMRHAHYESDNRDLRVPPKLGSSISDTAEYFEGVFVKQAQIPVTTMNVSASEDIPPSAPQEKTPSYDDAHALSAFLFWQAWQRLDQQYNVSLNAAPDHSHPYLTTFFIFCVLLGLCLAAEWYYGISAVMYGEYLEWKAYLKQKFRR